MLLSELGNQIENQINQHGDGEVKVGYYDSKQRLVLFHLICGVDRVNPDLTIVRIIPVGFPQEDE